MPVTQQNTLGSFSSGGSFLHGIAAEAKQFWQHMHDAAANYSGFSARIADLIKSDLVNVGGLAELFKQSKTSQAAQTPEDNKHSSTTLVDHDHHIHGPMLPPHH